MSAARSRYWCFREVNSRLTCYQKVVLIINGVCAISTRYDFFFTPLLLEIGFRRSAPRRGCFLAQRRRHSGGPEAPRREEEHGSGTMAPFQIQHKLNLRKGGP